MDSKYSAVGRQKEQKNSFGLKIKRLKLSTENNVKNNIEVEQNTSFNGVNQESNSKVDTDSNNTNEDLQEARRTLPVYQVRTR